MREMAPTLKSTFSTIAHLIKLHLQPTNSPLIIITQRSLERTPVLQRLLLSRKFKQSSLEPTSRVKRFKGSTNFSKFSLFSVYFKSSIRNKHCIYKKTNKKKWE